MRRHQLEELVDLLRLDLIDRHVVQAVDDSQAHVVVRNLQAVEESFFTVGLIEARADLLEQVLQLLALLIRDLRLLLSLHEQGELLAEKLDEFDDLNEEAVDNWIVQVLKRAFIAILLHDLILLIVVLLRVLQQVSILGQAEVRQQVLARLHSVDFVRELLWIRLDGLAVENFLSQVTYAREQDRIRVVVGQHLKQLLDQAFLEQLLAFRRLRVQQRCNKLDLSREDLVLLDCLGDVVLVVGWREILRLLVRVEGQFDLDHDLSVDVLVDVARGSRAVLLRNGVHTLEQVNVARLLRARLEENFRDKVV